LTAQKRRETVKTIEKLHTFIVLANCSSFTEAAEKLFCSQPAVSMKIHSLEEIFGVKLFDRMGKKMLLNQNGKDLLPYAQKMVDLFEEAKQMFKEKESTPQGTLTICASNFVGVYIMPTFLKKFKNLYPHVELKLHIHSYDQMIKSILSNEIDGAYMPIYKAESLDPRLAVRPFFQDQFVLTVPPTHPWTKLAFVSADTLNNEPFLLPQPTSPMKNFIESELKQSGIILDSIVELSNIEAIKKGIISNLGVSILPKLAIETEMDQGLLHSLPVQGMNFKRSICFVKHKDKQLSAAGSAFLTLVFENYDR
jgi:DNA-binding transcriptional LysR family regulator